VASSAGCHFVSLFRTACSDLILVLFFAQQRRRTQKLGIADNGFD